MSAPAPKASSKVLLVDDDAQILELIEMRLHSRGYDVSTADSGESALASIAVSRPDVVVTDLRMPGMDGLALFDAIHRAAPSLPVVILTAHGTIPEAVAATRHGVFSFLTKPFDPKVLLETVNEAIHFACPPSAEASDWSKEILTCSTGMQDLLVRARRVSASDVSVCIAGPSGTGKELLARAIHRASARASAPFVGINCSAIPEGLLEAELFGHKRGSFTGATQDRRGLFQAAENGTLLLDEVGDMPLTLQVKLLRTLEQRVVRPVGTNADIPVNVRIISATHRNLEERITTGEFREDLYYRLNVVKLTLPPLSDRREDIPLLTGHFLTRLSERYHRERLTVTPAAMNVLVSAPWPGNVRQLQNVIERVVALSSSKMVSESLVRDALEAWDITPTPFDEARHDFERGYLVRILKIAGGSVTRAARLAGRNRTEFYRLLERHALDLASFKQGRAASRAEDSDDLQDPD